MRSLKWKWGVGGAKDIALPPPFAEIIQEPSSFAVDAYTDVTYTALGNSSPQPTRYIWQFWNGSAFVSATTSALQTSYPAWTGTADATTETGGITDIHPDMDGIQMRLRVRNDDATVIVFGTPFTISVSDYAEAGYVEPGYVD